MINILVVDDDEGIRKMINFQLKKFDYRIFLAESWRKGLEILTEQKIDLVLLDQMMPEMNGMETFGKIKEQIKNPPPVLMVTAHGTLHLAVAFMKAGGIDFIEKPIVDFEILDIKIQQAIKVGEAERVNKEKEGLEILLTTVATLNHEINNPLSVIINRSIMLLEQQELSPESKKYINQVLVEGKRIGETVIKLNKAVVIRKVVYAGGSNILDIDNLV